MKKLTPIKASIDDAINSQLGVQVIEKTTPLSRDPENYPVFRTPVCKKVLIYVPNHIVQNAEGQDVLRMDAPLIHILQGKNNRYEYYRCVSGLKSDAHGYDGTCPLCDGASDPWTLANLIIEDRCKAQGLSPDDSENEKVKAIKSAAYNDRVLGDAERYFTFPIVVFDTVNDDAKTLVTDEKGNISYKIMWYSISERGWDKKWVKALENMEGEPTHPGGLFLSLDYTYTPKKGEPNARDSAREMNVFKKTVNGADKLRVILDKQTEGWTPEVAREYVIRNNLYAFEDLESVVEEGLQATRELIALYSAKGPSSGAIDGTPQFNLSKVDNPSEEAPTAVGETDEDLSIG